MKWISIQDQLPTEDQPILFVNDISQNPQDKFIHGLLERKFSMVTVKFGFVQTINVADPGDADDGNHDNWVEVRASKYYDSISGINGRADHVTHWMPLPTPPN
jgi:hypothetical protein